MGELFTIVFPIVGFIGAVIYARQRNAKAIDSWTRVANELQFTLTPMGSSKISIDHQLAGQLGGFQVRVYLEVRGTGRYARTYTLYYVTFSTQGPDVSLRSEMPTDGLAKRFGGKEDLQIGVPEFDNSVIIDGAGQALAQSYLTPARQAAVLSLFEAYPFAEVNGTGIIVEEQMVQADYLRLIGTIRQAVDTAAILHSPSATDGSAAA